MAKRPKDANRRHIENKAHESMYQAIVNQNFDEAESLLNDEKKDLLTSYAEGGRNFNPLMLVAATPSDKEDNALKFINNHHADVANALHKEDGHIYPLLALKHQNNELLKAFLEIGGGRSKNNPFYISICKELLKEPNKVSDLLIAVQGMENAPKPIELWKSFACYDYRNDDHKPSVELFQCFLENYPKSRSSDEELSPENAVQIMNNLYDEVPKIESRMLRSAASTDSASEEYKDEVGVLFEKMTLLCKHAPSLQSVTLGAPWNKLMEKVQSDLDVKRAWKLNLGNDDESANLLDETIKSQRALLDAMRDIKPQYHGYQSPASERLYNSYFPRSYFPKTELDAAAVDLVHCIMYGESADGIPDKAWEHRNACRTTALMYFYAHGDTAKLIPPENQPGLYQQVDKLGNGILHYLALGSAERTSEKNQEFIQKAKANKVNIDARNRAGQTPLMTAVLSNNVALLEDLIANGADINSVDRQGNSALIYACLMHNPNMIDAILQEPTVDVNVVNSQGLSPAVISYVKGGFAPTIDLQHQKKLVAKAMANLPVQLPDCIDPLKQKTELMSICFPPKESSMEISRKLFERGAALPMHGAIDEKEALPEIIHTTYVTRILHVAAACAAFVPALGVKVAAAAELANAAISAWVARKGSKVAFNEAYMDLTKDSKLDGKSSILKDDVLIGCYTEGAFGLKHGKDLALSDYVFKVNSPGSQIKTVDDMTPDKLEDLDDPWAAHTYQVLTQRYCSIQQKIEKLPWYNKFFTRKETDLQKISEEITGAQKKLREHFEFLYDRKDNPNAEEVLNWQTPVLAEDYWSLAKKRRDERANNGANREQDILENKQYSSKPTLFQRHLHTWKNKAEAHHAHNQQHRTNEYSEKIEALADLNGITNSEVVAKLAMGSSESVYQDIFARLFMGKAIDSNTSILKPKLHLEKSDRPNNTLNEANTVNDLRRDVLEGGPRFIINKITEIAKDIYYLYNPNRLKLLEPTRQTNQLPNLEHNKNSINIDEIEGAIQQYRNDKASKGNEITHQSVEPSRMPIKKRPVVSVGSDSKILIPTFNNAHILLDLGNEESEKGLQRGKSG